MEKMESIIILFVLGAILTLVIVNFTLKNRAKKMERHFNEDLYRYIHSPTKFNNKPLVTVNRIILRSYNGDYPDGFVSRFLGLDEGVDENLFVENNIKSAIKLHTHFGLSTGEVRLKE